MTELERAEAYASIFANVGDRWRKFVPVDAIEFVDGIRLGDITLERVDVRVWRLTEPGRSWLVAKERPSG